MTPAPVTFETWVNAALDPTFNTNPYTYQTSVSGTFTTITGTFTETEQFSFSSYGKQEFDSTGGYTGIFTVDEPILSFDQELDFQTWIWGNVRFLNGLVAQTVQSDFIGTSETVVSAEFRFSDDEITATTIETIISETLASETQTAASFLQWTTTNTETNVITTQSADTQETFWTYSETQNTSEAEWVTTDRAASTQGTTRTNGSKQEITTSGISLTFDSEEARSTKKITRSTATYNRLILTTANRPNALETVASVDPQKRSATSTFYGELSYTQPPTVSSFDDVPVTVGNVGGVFLSGGDAGYTTNLVVTATSGPLSWTQTVKANRASAGISLGNNPPRVIEGEVVVSGSPVNSQNQQVTSTADATVLTKGIATTTLASFVTMALGPAQTTRSFSYLENINTAVGVPLGGFGDMPDGFSASSAGPITMRVALGFGNFNIVPANASVESRANAITVSPQVGFTSSIAALQTSRINTLKFAVVGQGGNSGTSYQNGLEFNTVTAKSLVFAPKSAQEFLPITGSASSSNTSRSFSMKYSGAAQSRSSTIGTGTDATITSETSAWSATGAAQTFWVDVSRGRVEGSPDFPTIPALIIGGEGQALITRGLYETYSGSGTATASGTNNFVEVNTVSSFSASGGVTAIKPLQYFVPITATNAQTTSASFANNLTAQPLDD
jgi:hypothetical protein